MSQSPGSKAVTIRYTLDNEPAVITLDVTTNGVSIGGANIDRLVGDVNRVVQPGVREIRWRPDKSWPGHVVSNNAVRAVVTAWATDVPPDYVVFDTVGKGGALYYQSADFLPDGGLTNPVYKTDRLVMRRIPAAGVTWRMGSPVNEPERFTGDYRYNPPKNEGTHLVRLTKDYYIGIYELTQKQYLNLVGSNGSSYRGAGWETHPWENANYYHIRRDTWIPSKEWPEKPLAEKDIPLSVMRDKLGVDVDLPTEAMWEYAARAGSGTGLPFGLDIVWGDTGENVDRFAWHKDNSDLVTHEVGLKEPNAWGLYDMLGNVWEWCIDQYADNYAATPGEVSVDPKGCEIRSTSTRAIRGGSGDGPVWHCRLASRSGNWTASTATGTPWRGMRLAAPAIAK